MKFDVHLEGDRCWEDLLPLHKQGKLIHLPDPQIAVAALRGGMQTGNTSVAVRIDLPDGQVVIAETSLRLFLLAADLLRDKYPNG